MPDPKPDRATAVAQMLGIKTYPPAHRFDDWSKFRSACSPRTLDEEITVRALWSNRNGAKPRPATKPAPRVGPRTFRAAERNATAGTAATSPHRSQLVTTGRAVPETGGRSYGGGAKNESGITLSYPSQGGRTLGQTWAEQQGEDAGPVNPQFIPSSEPQPRRASEATTL